MLTYQHITILLQISHCILKIDVFTCQKLLFNPLIHLTTEICSFTLHKFFMSHFLVNFGVPVT